MSQKHPIYVEQDLFIDYKYSVFYKNKKIGHLFLNTHNNKYLFSPKTDIMISQNCLNLLSSAFNSLNKE